jgi:hypothetical protein
LAYSEGYLLLARRWLSNDADENCLMKGSSRRNQVTIGYPCILAMTSKSAMTPSKENARKVQTENSLTASWNRAQFVSQMSFKAAMYGRQFFRVEGVCAIVESRWLFTEEPHWDLHVNEVIHGYHAQQFEIF